MRPSPDPVGSSEGAGGLGLPTDGVPRPPGPERSHLPSYQKRDQKAGFRTKSSDSKQTELTFMFVYSGFVKIRFSDPGRHFQLRRLGLRPAPRPVCPHHDDSWVLGVGAVRGGQLCTQSCSPPPAAASGFGERSGWKCVACTSEASGRCPPPCPRFLRAQICYFDCFAEAPPAALGLCELAA